MDRERLTTPTNANSRRLWLHGLLFVVTFLSTTALGSRLADNFHNHLPPFNVDRDFLVFRDMFLEPRLLLHGLPYSIPLMAILLAHELGHYFACLWYGIEASLPFFLPAPTFIGTFGAFIRLRSAVKSRRELFDVGVAGPIAGFILVIPALGVGMALSQIVPGIGSEGEFRFGTPLLIRGLEWFLFPGIAPEDISLHPMAIAGWVGLLMTSLNLLPIGQLDGGHLVYAAIGDGHRRVALTGIALLIPLGFIYWPWWAWAVVLFFLGWKHFTVVDETPLDAPRLWLLGVAVAIFILAFNPAPVHSPGGSWFGS